MNRSRLTFPGPANNKVMKQARNNPAFNPTPKKSLLLANTSATAIVIIREIDASLVNNPKTINAPQKNSANNTNARDVVEPI